MRYIKQLLIILCVSFAGELLHKFLPLPVPAGIYGVGLLFGCLELKIVKLSSVKETANFLLEIMPIMFIPPAVGLIEILDVLYPKGLIYFTVVFASTFAVMFAAGKTTQYIVCNLFKRGRNNE